LVCAVPVVPSSLETTVSRDEPTQLRRLVDATEAQLRKVQEEKEKDTESLKKEKEEVLEKLRVARYCVTAYKNEKDEFWTMLEEDKEKIQREKDQLLAEQPTVKEAVSKALRSVPGLA
jgi:aspartyl/asparaginyl-tRNA synthetase